MKYDLPAVNWQHLNMNVPGQLKKIGEEYSEVAEALAEGKYGKAIAETLDLMQTCDTMLSILMKQYNIPELDTYLKAHEEKLHRKGYLSTCQYCNGPRPCLTCSSD